MAEESLISNLTSGGPDDWPGSELAVHTTGTDPVNGDHKIKKIPPGMRRIKTDHKVAGNILSRTIFRLKNDSQFFRSSVQAAFLLLCIWIGIEFYLFMRWGESGGLLPHYERPPGVEGFLPISALISLKYWFKTGVINGVHPSGMFILLAILAVGYLLRKSFCSWLCPVGTISEGLWMLGKKIFGKNLKINRWLDYPLRGLKYLLLLFFVYSIWQMDTGMLKSFIYSPYNKVADIKMYLFFAYISSFAIWTIIILMLFSLFIKNFWCRYLCPYGGLLGMLGWFSPSKVTRKKESCIDCELCTKACPADIKVHKASKVWSDECTNCLACVEACPVRETLEIKTSVSRTAVPNWIFGLLVVGVFIGITGLAMLTGNWQNEISDQEYLKRFNELDTPLYQHNRGEVPEYKSED